MEKQPIDMAEYRYILERKSKKHRCPACSKMRFVRYIDSSTGQHLAPKYGRCDRESNCGYHEQPPAGTMAYFVAFDAIEDYSDKAFKLIVGEKMHYVPKSQTFDKTESGAYIADFILSENKALTCVSTDVRFYDTDTGKSIAIEATAKPQPKKPTTYIPEKVLQQTHKAYDQNTFIQNLLQRVPFPISFEDVMLAVRLYQLGTIIKGSRKGAITFPFIDKRGNCRTIQAKQFDETNHTTSTDFLHSMLSRNYERENKPLPAWLRNYLQNERYVSCLFGEHLLKRYINKPIALVEAPKTAIISTLYFGFPEDAPDNYLWLAVYNLSSLTVEKCRALHGRDVVLFPDLKAFDKWNQRAKELQAAIPEATFKVSDYLERKAPDEDRAAGYDLADYLVNFDWRLFRPEPTPTPPAIIPQPEPACTVQNEKAEKNVRPEKTFFSDPMPVIYPPKKPEPWPDVDELIEYFENTTLPDSPLQLNDWETITDVRQFVGAHIEVVRAQDGKRVYLPYYERLNRIKQMLMN